MKRILVCSFVFIFGFAVGYFCNKPAYEFYVEPPHFDEREKEIIKMVYGKIVDSLENPSEFFISQIADDDTNITVYLSLLQTLQSGADKKSGKFSTVMDGGESFVFDANYNFVQQKTEKQFHN